MDRTSVMRRALWLSAFFNLSAALMFLFPASIGRLAGLPLPVSPVYTQFIALIVGLFGATYVWLARQRQIDQPLVVVATIGKLGAFGIFLAAWATGEIPFRGALLASGDLVFASIFAWWLIGGPASQDPEPWRA